MANRALSTLLEIVDDPRADQGGGLCSGLEVRPESPVSVSGWEAAICCGLNLSERVRPPPDNDHGASESAHGTVAIW